jgi:MarR family transcriptional regulator, organic hydroperoxide resistance regulator
LASDDNSAALRNKRATRQSSFLPLSTSKPVLLHNGSEAKFRRALYDMFAVAATLEAGQREFAKKIDVAPSQFMILRIIAEGHRSGGTTVTKIAKSLFLHNSFVVLQAGRLVTMGLVKRVKNPDDMRSLLLHLTAKGEDAIFSLNKAVMVANDTLFGWMSRQEFEQFSAIVGKIAQQGPATLSAIQLTSAELPSKRSK